MARDEVRGADERRLAEITGELDLARPNAARMYDYYLGGAQNFQVDRDAAKQALASVPARVFALANRAFLSRVVRYLAAQGVEQFLDLGTGLPTVGNVHEVAHGVNSAARIAYVDVEPVAVAHARMLLGDDPRVSVTQADIRRPADVLSAPGVSDLLDFRRPVAVLAFAVMHFVGEADDPAAVLAGYRDASAPGSYLGLSHLSRVNVSDEQVASTTAVYRNTATPVTLRDREGITALFAGYEFVDPGVVLLDQWRPDDAAVDDRAQDSNAYAGLGYLP